MGDMKFTVKDSVFSFIFKHPENILQLYQALHPEDTDVTEEDCHLVTLEHILTNGITNDLGFRVRDRLILLMEAQTKFSHNIVLRMLLYLSDTYKEYADEQKLDLYGSKSVSIPRPELYMIYTGAPQPVPEVLHLSELYEGPGDVEVTVKVLRDSGTKSIVDQYIRFCEISDEQRRLYGYERKAVEEILRICCEENILMPFLASRQKEVRTIMVTLFNQERVSEIHDYNIARNAHMKGHMEGHKEGRAEGHKEGREEGIQAMVRLLKKVAPDQTSAAQELAIQFDLSAQLATEKVEQYWEE